MPRKNFMTSWLIYQAQNAEIKMFTATSMLWYNISKILCEVRYTRLDIGVFRKLFNTDLFSTPYLMSPDVPLETSYLDMVLFAWIIQGSVCDSVAQSFTVCAQEPLKGSFADLSWWVLCRIRYMITKLKIMQYEPIPKSRSNVAYPLLYALLFFLISKYSKTQSRDFFL